MTREPTYEDKVRSTVKNYLMNNLDDKYAVRMGEINIAKTNDIKWFADIVVGRAIFNTIDEIDFAIECKGKSGIRKGIGQALSYKYICGTAGIAAYNIDGIHIGLISTLPLFCFNILPEEEFGPNAIKVESYPNDKYTSINSEIDSAGKLEDIVDENLDRINELENEIERKEEELEKEDCDEYEYINYPLS